MSINLTLIPSLGYPGKLISAIPYFTLAILAIESVMQLIVVVEVTAPLLRMCEQKSSVTCE
jgi:hypothetical protein